MFFFKISSCNLISPFVRKLFMKIHYNCILSFFQLCSSKSYNVCRDGTVDSSAVSVSYDRRTFNYPENRRSPPTIINVQFQMNHYQPRNLPSSTNACYRSSKNVLRARRRVIRMLTIIVLTFAICNLPFHARKMWQYWSTQYDGTSTFSSLFTPVTFLCIYCNSLINPLLYAFLSKNFQKSIRDFLKCSWREKTKLRQMSFQQKSRSRSMTRACSVSNNRWHTIFRSKPANEFTHFPSNSLKVQELSSEDYDEWEQMTVSELMDISLNQASSV